MDGSTAAGLPDAPVRGYSRAELDEFLTQAATERARLEATIAADEERIRRGRAALGTHRVMVAMLLAAQRELDDIRARAEREAAAILAGAGRPEPVLDLTRSEPAPPVSPVPPAPVQVASVAPSVTGDADAHDYFDFLRGALDDDAPLGPRPEPA
jgi:cell division septum initiation protein DivIVA